MPVMMCVLFVFFSENTRHKCSKLDELFCPSKVLVLYYLPKSMLTFHCPGLRPRATSYRGGKKICWKITFLPFAAIFNSESRIFGFCHLTVCSGYPAHISVSPGVYLDFGSNLELPEQTVQDCKNLKNSQTLRLYKQFVPQIPSSTQSYTARLGKRKCVSDPSYYLVEIVPRW